MIEYLIFPIDHIILTIGLIVVISCFWKGIISSILGLLTWIGSIFITIYFYNNLSIFINKQLINIEILQNYEDIISSFLTKSLFQNKKIIIISRATEKLINFVKDILERGIIDTKILIKSSTLEKKSKLRNLFEKDKKTICIPFYPDTPQILNKIASDFFKNKKILVSYEMINLIVERSRGSRQNLINELNKIENYCKNNNKINLDILAKITNLAENYHVSELLNIND